MTDFKALSIEHPVRGLFGLVLSVYSMGLDKDSPLSDLSWLTSALHHSTSLKKNDRNLTRLRQKVQSFNVDDAQNLTVDQGLGLIVGLKVLHDAGLIDDSGLIKYSPYFEKVSNTSWFRVREVATLFCYAFKDVAQFNDLVSNATYYLKGEFGKNHNPLGATLFGLSLTNKIDELITPEVVASIKKLLDSKVPSVEELGYLCLALKASKDLDLKQEALNKFQNAVYDQLYEVTSENSEVISLLLTILYISASETDGEQILDKLKRSNIKEETKKRVHEILKSNDILHVAFKDSNPVDPPIFKSMAISLFALSQTQLSQVYLFNQDLKNKVENYLATTNDKNLKLISEKILYVLLIIFDVVIVYLGFKYWWPLFDTIFNSIDELQGSVWKKLLDIVSWVVFALPFYITINLNWGVLEKGFVTFSELFDLQYKKLLKLINRFRKE